MSDNIKIGAEVEVSPASNQNIKGLKQQLRDALKEAQTLSAQDLGSKEAIAAQKRVAELRDKIEDTNEAISAFTGAGQFKAIGNAVQGIAGGFAAAQGAMALFGNDSEGLQKTLVKLNAAMAFSQGLASLEGLKDSFGALGNMIKTNVVSAFTTLRGALIATGIGAIAVGVGLLAANWGKVVKIVREFIGLGPSQAEIIEEQTKALEEQNKAIEHGQQLQDYGVRRLEGRNKEIAAQTKAHTDEILALEKKYQDDLAKIRDDENLTDEEREKQRTKLQIQNGENRRAMIEAQEAEQLALKDKFRQEDLKKQRDADKKRMELFEAEMYAQIDAQKQLNDMISQMEAEATQAEIDRMNAEFDAYLDSQDATTEAAKAAADAQREIDMEKIASKVEVADTTLGLLDNVNKAAGNNFEVGKAISVAQTTVDTFEGTQTAFKQAQKNPVSIAFPAYPYIAAGAALAAGIARIVSIKNTKVGSSSSGSSASSSTAPSLPSYRPATGTDVTGAGDVMVSTKQSPMKVYVVESEITNVQNKVKVMNNTARL